VGRRYPLNPCDYLFFTHHTMMRSKGQSGNLPFMVMELEGGPEPDALIEAVRRTLDAHPAVRSRARLSLLWAHPYWQVRDALDRPPVEVLDLRDSPDWTRPADTLCEARLAEGWEVDRSPQVKLELYRGPRGRSRICLRWPHALMDAEGAQWFMSEVDRVGGGAAASADHLADDDDRIDVLRGRGFLNRLKLFRQGKASYRAPEGVRLDGFADGPSSGGRWRFTHRSWSGEVFSELRRRADELCPSGPAKFSRFLASSVLRALHAMFERRGLATRAYLVTLPMRARGVPERRPVPGNYLVSATLCATRESVADQRGLIADLGRQIEGYLARNEDLSNWALVWAAGHFRAWQYRWYLSQPRGLAPYASGFSFYGEIPRPIRSFLGAKVLNFWGSGSMSAPPGWNPVFSRFGDTLNLGLTWLEGFYREATATEYLDRIEAELFGRGDR